MSQEPIDNSSDVQVVSMNGKYFAEISVPAGEAPLGLSPANIIQVAPVHVITNPPYTLAEDDFALGLIEQTATKEKRALRLKDFKDITTQLNNAFAGQPVYIGTKLAASVPRGPQRIGSTNVKEKTDRNSVSSWIIPVRNAEAVLDHFTRGGPRDRYNAICQRVVGKRETMYGNERSKSQGTLQASVVAPPTKNIWTLKEYDTAFALTKAKLENKKKALTMRDFVSIVESLNECFALKIASVGEELPPVGQRARSSTKTSHTMPTRNARAVYDYVTRGHQPEYNALCQVLVGNSEKEYGYVRANKRVRVEDGDEGEDDAVEDGDGGYGAGMGNMGSTGEMGMIEMIGGMGSMAGADSGHYQQRGYGNIPDFHAQEFGYVQAQDYQHPPPPPESPWGPPPEYYYGYY